STSHSPTSKRSGSGRSATGATSSANSRFFSKTAFRPKLNEPGSPRIARYTVDRTLPRQRLSCPVGIGFERFPPVAAGMSPAGDFDQGPALVEMVEDGVRIGDEIALVSGEQSVDRGAVV